MIRSRSSFDLVAQSQSQHRGAVFERKASAIEDLRRIVAMNEGNDVARAALGNLLAEAGDTAGAMRSSSRLAHCHPDNAEAWFNLGFLHDKRDNSQEAERASAARCELKPITRPRMVRARPGADPRRPARGGGRGAAAEHQAAAVLALRLLPARHDLPPSRHAARGGKGPRAAGRNSSPSSPRR